MKGGRGVAGTASGLGAMRGQLVDGEGRCAHWHGPDDVLLIALPCCAGFWGCRTCHDEIAQHAARRWSPDAVEEAFLCGRCGTAQSVRDYMTSPGGCPACGRPFNPRCGLHRHLYVADSDQNGSSVLPASDAP